MKPVFPGLQAVDAPPDEDVAVPVELQHVDASIDRVPHAAAAVDVYEGDPGSDVGGRVVVDGPVVQGLRRPVVVLESVAIVVQIFS